MFDEDNQKYRHSQDIFEQQIIAKNHQTSLEMTQKALRISMSARGYNSLEDKPVQINFKVRKQKIKVLSHQEQTQKRYGFQGVLLKQSPNFFGGWQQRFCILKGNRFVYKQTSQATSPNHGIINFNLLSCEIEILLSGSVFKICIFNCDKKFVFRGQTLQQTSEWIKRIKKANQTSEGFGKQFKYLTHYHRFWRKDYISLKQFSNSVSTGDIILFRGTKNTSVMQRAFTGDEYDHVAVVIMNCKSQPLIFEADGRGVGICPWSQFITKKFYTNYDLIVHRHLNVSRNQQFSEIVDRFIGANIGKQYNFSLKDYLFSRTSTSQGDKQVYFCSSLVAKLYKNLELLKPNKSSTQYLPSWFSNRDAKLRKDGKFGNATFDDEKIIVFQNIPN